MIDELTQIAEHFDALASALAELKALHSGDPQKVDRIEAARLRAIKGAELARSELGKRR